MNIAIDARYVADHFPGIGRYVYNLISALAELDQSHRLIVIHNPALLNSRYDMPTLARLPNAELIAVSAPPFSLAEHVRLPVLLRQIRADVYHAPYYVRPYVALPCPTVTTLYDAIPRLFPAEVSPRARLLFDVLTRLAVHNSQRLLAISESARADLIGAYAIEPERIAVTPLAADARFRPQSAAAIDALRTRYRLRARYVLTLAANKPHKNLPLLIAAWAQLIRTPGFPPDFVLVVAGHWDPRFPAARHAVERLRLGDRVRFLPNVADADLPALYAGATVFVFPSRYEGFGLPPLEALACGAPVLCGNVSSLPEVVGAAALKVDMNSVDELARGLAQLLHDGALRRSLAEAGPIQAARFSWRQAAGATLAVYEAAVC